MVPVPPAANEIVEVVPFGAPLWCRRRWPR
jgi:hypothetical protein